MIKKLLTFALGFVVLTTSNFTITSAQTTTADAAATAKIKADVLKRGTGKNRRVNVKMHGGTKITGDLSRINDDSFTLVDSKTNQPIDIAYSRVAQVKSSGSIPLAAKICLGAAAAAAITVAILFRIRYCNEHSC